MRLCFAFGIALLLLSPSASLALLCAEKDKLTGSVTLTNGTSDDGPNEFCVFSVGIGAASTRRPALFGIGNAGDNMTPAYGNIFVQNTGTGDNERYRYAVLGICVLEGYRVVMERDVLLRCFCKWDRCNEAADLDSFMKQLAKHDLELSTEQELVAVAAAARKRNSAFNYRNYYMD